MEIEKETDRPALKLTHWGYNRETKWVIIMLDSTTNYPSYGNVGYWYSDIHDAEEFDSIEEAKAHLNEYGYNALVAFVEIEHTIHSTHLMRTNQP